MESILDTIIRCFKEDKVLYTSHARNEMVREEYGRIYESEIFEAVLDGEIIRSYEDDRPYPSYLLYGETSSHRPIHVVLAYNQDEDVLIVITTYQPTAELWIDYRTRRKQ